MRTTDLTLFAASVLCTALAGNPPAASAATTDGNWSVQIITEKGTCGSARLDNVNVSHGRVAYRGIAPVNVAGTVAANGLVRVNITAGDQGARGTGRLLASGGHGVWRGHGTRGQCTGRWVAERR
jgi:hypothetical protein